MFFGTFYANRNDTRKKYSRPAAQNTFSSWNVHGQANMMLYSCQEPFQRTHYIDNMYIPQKNLWKKVNTAAAIAQFSYTYIIWINVRTLSNFWSYTIEKPLWSDHEGVEILLSILNNKIMINRNTGIASLLYLFGRTTSHCMLDLNMAWNASWSNRETRERSTVMECINLTMIHLGAAAQSLVVYYMTRPLRISLVGVKQVG